MSPNRMNLNYRWQRAEPTYSNKWTHLTLYSTSIVLAGFRLKIGYYIL